MRPTRDLDQPCRSEGGWLAEALSRARAAAWSWEAASGRFEVTPGAEALLGEVPRSAEEYGALLHDEDRAARASVVSRALARGEPWTARFRLARAEARWVEERGHGLPGTGAHALLFDATSCKEAELALERRRSGEEQGRWAAEAAARELARSEALLNSILDSMSDGLVLYAPDASITRMNPRAAEIFRYADADRAEPAASRLARIRVLDVDGRAVPFESLPIVAALRGESLSGVPLALQFTDGRVVWTSMGAAPIRGPSGEIAGAVVTLADLTRLREQEQLREDLARMISHDLRAPLGVILAQSRLIGRRAESPEALRARVDAIATSAQRMAVMLNDLVESALLEAGKLRLELEPVDAVAMVTDLRSRLAAPFDGERIRIEAAPGVPKALADANRIERVLVNLLTNALKYSAPDTEVVVRVAADAGQVVLDVVDQGQGIAPADLPHLFERYFRAVGTSRFEGMGVGLYAARRLVEAHGGTISASSVQGRGSVFRVRLPAATGGG